MTPQSQFEQYLSAYVWSNSYKESNTPFQNNLQQLNYMQQLAQDSVVHCTEAIAQNNHISLDWYLKVLLSLKSWNITPSTEFNWEYLQVILPALEVAALKNGQKIPGYQGIKNCDPFWSKPKDWPQPELLISNYNKFFTGAA